jgi:hypothetical protein
MLVRHEPGCFVPVANIVEVMMSKKRPGVREALLIVVLPLCFVGFWILAFSIKHYNATRFSIQENYDHAPGFPFLIKDISHVNVGMGSFMYFEGTASSWEDVKVHRRFKNLQWQQIDEERGIVVQCYKFEKIHESQAESYAQNQPTTHITIFYDHRIYRGFFAEAKEGYIFEKVYFDSDAIWRLRYLFFRHFAYCLYNGRRWCFFAERADEGARQCSPT